MHPQKLYMFGKKKTSKDNLLKYVIFERIHGDFPRIRMEIESLFLFTILESPSQICTPKLTESTVKMYFLVYISIMMQCYLQ